MSTPDAPRSQGRPPPFLTERGERHASWLELFFDLVFVAAVAALARQLQADRSVGGLLVFAGLFVPVWWGWMGFTWYFTTFGTETSIVRVGVLSAMAAIAAVSAGVEGAANDASDTFVVAYAVLLSVLAALYARAWLLAPAARSLAARFTIGNALGAVLWLSSLALDERARPFLWATAMVLVIATFMFAGWQTVAPALQPYDRGHIAERYGLFTIVVLGEAVVVTVSGLDTVSRLTAGGRPIRPVGRRSIWLRRLVSFLPKGRLRWRRSQPRRLGPCHPCDPEPSTSSSTCSCRRWHDRVGAEHPTRACPLSCGRPRQGWRHSPARARRAGSSGCTRRSAHR